MNEKDEEEGIIKKQLQIKTNYVDVIIPMHNSSKTIKETIESIQRQEREAVTEAKDEDEVMKLDILISCYDDASTDDTIKIVNDLKEASDESKHMMLDDQLISIEILLTKSHDNKSHGAGFARNQSVQSASAHRRNSSNDIDTDFYFLCFIDSDDIMHRHRIYRQLSYFGSLDLAERRKTLCGTKFDRIPKDSTWHYTTWANSLPKERLVLEQFREVTIIQPTWMMLRTRFVELGGYIDSLPNSLADEASRDLPDKCYNDSNNYQMTKRVKVDSSTDIYQLIHGTYDNSQTIRLAEDLRFFHAHLRTNNGLLHLIPCSLVMYRHNNQQTNQSSQTSRLLLFQLRVKVFEDFIIKNWNKFVIWGAGRDGKLFLKYLRNREKVAAFVDVDEKKINAKFYANKDLNIKIPILHFSKLRQIDSGSSSLNEFGNISKQKSVQSLESFHLVHDMLSKMNERFNEIQPENNSKQLEILLPSLPVVVCVAMYRTCGVLERNVASIGRKEGHNLWFFS